MDRFLGLVKVFVVVAGIIIVAGTVALVWLLASRDDPTSSVERVRVAAPTPNAASPQSPGTVASDAEVLADLPVPAGAVVIDMSVAGSAALLLLRSVEGQEYLAVVDLPSGQRRSLLKLVPELR